MSYCVASASRNWGVSNQIVLRGGVRGDGCNWSVMFFLYQYFFNLSTIWKCLPWEKTASIYTGTKRTYPWYDLVSRFCMLICTWTRVVCWFYPILLSVFVSENIELLPVNWFFFRIIYLLLCFLHALAVFVFWLRSKNYQKKKIHPELVAITSLAGVKFKGFQAARQSGRS